jgi:hypothetical protein
MIDNSSEKCSVIQVSYKHAELFPPKREKHNLVYKVAPDMRFGHELANREF